MNIELSAEDASVVVKGLRDAADRVYDREVREYEYLHEDWIKSNQKKFKELQAEREQIRKQAEGCRRLADLIEAANK